MKHSKEELETIETILKTILQKDRHLVFHYDCYVLHYVDTQINKKKEDGPTINDKIKLVVEAINLIFETKYQAQRYVHQVTIDQPLIIDQPTEYKLQYNQVTRNLTTYARRRVATLNCNYKITYGDWTEWEEVKSVQF